MIKLILFTFSFVISVFPVYCQSAGIPDGAGGLKFGMSVAEVKNIWRAKGNPPGEFEPSKPGLVSLSYYKVKIGVQKFDFCVLRFVNDKLYDIIFCKIPERESFGQDYYDTQQKIITSEYGQGVSYRFMDPDDELGSERDKMNAVKCGFAKIRTCWSFKDISAISLEIKEIDDKITIVTQYQSTELYKEVKAILHEDTSIRCPVRNPTRKI